MLLLLTFPVGFLRFYYFLGEGTPIEQWGATALPPAPSFPAPLLIHTSIRLSGH